MKEYTILAIISVIIVIMVDLASGIKLLQKKLYYLFLAIIFGFKLLVNGYLTANIVKYNPAFFSSIRLGTIPVEDFLFGFSMVTLGVIVWEQFKIKESLS